MRRVGLFGTWAFAAAACAVLFAGAAGAAERFEDLFFFQSVRVEPGFSAVWDLARSIPAKDQTAGNYLVDVNETGTWNALLRDSWRAPGDASQIAPRAGLDVVADRDGSLAMTSAEGGGLAARLGPPTQSSHAQIIGATKIGVQFRRGSVERKEMKAEGWVVQETTADDLLDAKKIERIALWDSKGDPIYFTLRDDQSYVAARVDSAGNVVTAVSSLVRWTKTAEVTSGPKYASSWGLTVPDWKWQAVLAADGTPSVSSGRIVQHVSGTAVGAKGSQRLQGISDLRIR
jgi:hypothetical protein